MNNHRENLDTLLAKIDEVLSDFPAESLPVKIDEPELGEEK